MEENTNIPKAEVPQPDPYPYYLPRPRPAYPVGRREACFALATLFGALLAVNGMMAGWLNLAFALGALTVTVSAAVYLRACGHRATPYSAAILTLVCVIIAAFPRSGDYVLKALTFLALPVVSSLGLTLLSGKNRYAPAQLSSLFDGFDALFGLGIGCMAPSMRGMKRGIGAAGRGGKTVGGVALGVLIAVPLLAVVLNLLISADAAFAGLVGKLPELEVGEAVRTAVFGCLLACICYSRAAALQNREKQEKARRARKGLSAVTVNTVLTAVAAVYAVYLFSQTAYFVSGFAGILPAGYTLAEYARRGFFEMAWLAAINLAVVGLAMYLVTAKGDAPGLTKGLCLLVGLVTLFLISAASAKMLLYIRAYGLTRLRVLTQVFMLWLAVTTVSVCVRIFRVRTAYMKCALLTALILCAALLWADVDTVVARHNVRAYQAGTLETVDMEHLGWLGDGAVPYIAELCDDRDPDVAAHAKEILADRCAPETDLRGWNFAAARAKPYLAGPGAEPA